MRRRPAPPPAGLELVVDVLAAWRVTRFVVEDTLWERQRDWLLERVPPKVEELLGCPHCVGVWVSAGVLAARWRAPGVWRPVGRWLAVAGAITLVADHLAD